MKLKKTRKKNLSRFSFRKFGHLSLHNNLSATTVAYKD